MSPSAPANFSKRYASKSASRTLNSFLGTGMDRHAKKHAWQGTVQWIMAARYCKMLRRCGSAKVRHTHVKMHSTKQKKYLAGPSTRLRLGIKISHLIFTQHHTPRTGTDHYDWTPQTSLPTWCQGSVAEWVLICFVPSLDVPVSSPGRAADPGGVKNKIAIVLYANNRAKLHLNIHSDSGWVMSNETEGPWKSLHIVRIISNSQVVQ